MVQSAGKVGPDIFGNPKIRPATHVWVDSSGIPRDYLLYQHDLAFFIQGMVTGACTLIASSMMRIRLLMVVLTAVLPEN